MVLGVKPRDKLLAVDPMASCTKELQEDGTRQFVARDSDGIVLAKHPTAAGAWLYAWEEYNGRKTRAGENKHWIGF